MLGGSLALRSRSGCGAPGPAAAQAPGLRHFSAARSLGCPGLGAWLSGSTERLGAVCKSSAWRTVRHTVKAVLAVTVQTASASGSPRVWGPRENLQQGGACLRPKACLCRGVC